MRLVDAHTHIRPDQQEQAIELAEQGLWQLATATGIDECERVLDLARYSPRIIPTCGLHPWRAAELDTQGLEKCLLRVPIIGEIGLDAVWTDVPMDVQLEAFVFQLQLAADLCKPVVLHTKGAEAEVLHWLKRYTPSRVIVHWYSGSAKHLQGYVELGCYFTLGPDIHVNPAVQAVCKQVPLDHLLTETDGIEAVVWALGKSYTMEAVPNVLLGILTTAAKLRGLSLAQIQERVYANSHAFLSGIISPPVQ